MAKMVLLPILIVLLASTVVSGLSDNVVTGPFTIGFAIEAPVKPAINVTEPIVHIGFDEYFFQVKASPFKGKMINVTIDDYRNSTDVSEPRLMNLVTDTIKSQSYKINWNKVNIGNVPGLMAQIRETESLTSYSISVYSPDGNGERGNTIILIKSSLSDDLTNSFLQNFKVSRA